MVHFNEAWSRQVVFVNDFVQYLSTDVRNPVYLGNSIGIVCIALIVWSLLSFLKLYFLSKNSVRLGDINCRA